MALTMGRPPIGTSARTVVGACRLTEAEKAALISRYGTVANFFRRMVDQELAKDNA